MKLRSVLGAGLTLILLAGVTLTPARQPARAAGVVGDGSPGSCTEAAFLTELAGGGLVTFNCGGAPHTIFLTAAGGVAAPVATSTTVDGGGLITFSAANVAGRRLFQVGPTAALTLTALTLVNATMDTFAGGALYNGGTLVLDDVWIEATGAQGFWGGGAVYNTGTLVVRDSELRHNNSAGGGAIYNEVGARALIEGTTFYSNTVGDGGYAGAISNSGYMTITASAFTENAHDLVSVNCIDILDNVCGGGAITNLAGAKLVISATTFTGNTSTIYGGAILNKGWLSLSQASLSGNASAYVGGAVMNAVTATATLTEVVFSGNVSEFGGGMGNFGASHAYLTNVTFQNNAATFLYGGGLYNADAQATITGATFTGNSAAFRGGAIGNFEGGVITVTNATLNQNTAGTRGGGVASYIGTVTLRHVTISSNSIITGSLGGGIDTEADASSHLNLVNVLLAANSPSNCSGQLPDSATFSLSTDSTCFIGNNGNFLAAQQPLGPLADNGGPTLTQMIGAGSPAEDSGQCLVGLTVDQRGLPRLVGNSCDIGAVERQADDIGWYLFLPLIQR